MLTHLFFQFLSALTIIFRNVWRTEPTPLVYSMYLLLLLPSFFQYQIYRARVKQNRSFGPMIDMQNKTPVTWKFFSHVTEGFVFPLAILFYISYFFTNSARIAFTTAMTITPTSAKIAIHILAMPRAPSSRQISLIPMAK